MDPTVERLVTPEECEQFIINVSERRPDLAQQARRRAIELCAKKFGASSAAEREAYEAVYAYEAVRTKPGGRKFRATRTWQMIERHGVIGAIERAVDRDDDPVGYTSLAAMNMTDLSFEAVVLRHPSSFNSKIVDRCRERLERYKAVAGQGS